MEQAVWLGFGVIAVIMGFAVIASLLNTNKEEQMHRAFLVSVEKLKDECNFVCNSPVDTYLKVDTEMPAGIRLYTDGKRICANLNISKEYDNETKCAICACPVELNGSFDLQNQLARKTFSTHIYSCYFLRRADGTIMECKG